MMCVVAPKMYILHQLVFPTHNPNSYFDPYYEVHLFHDFVTTIVRSHASFGPFVLPLEDDVCAQAT